LNSRPPTNPPRRSPAAPNSSAGERLQKLLAAAGFGSRREIETWIAAGRVSVRGQTAKLGDRAAPGDEVLLDGKQIKFSASRSQPRVIAYHKPVGELVTRSDPEGRATVFDKLPKLSPGRWVAVGRLDLNSSGLLLFTDSGELANQLMHPRQEIEREYEVRVRGGLPDDAVRRLLAGIELDDGPARFKRLEPLKTHKDAGTNRWYRAVLAEGRNREVRRMVEAAGARVSRLMRVRFGCIALPRELAPGRWFEVDAGRTQNLIHTARN
jgi:23S rRNA pseudouridine2605 synthase